MPLDGNATTVPDLAVFKHPLKWKTFLTHLSNELE